MKWFKKYYLYISLIFATIIVLTSFIYIFKYNNDESFVDWKLTPVYRGSGFDQLIYNITIQNVGNAKAEYVKMFIFQENDQDNFTKGDFTGGGSFLFKPQQAATFEYGVPLKNVKSNNDLLQVRKTVRLQVLWKINNVTKNKIFVLEPNIGSSS